MWPECEHKSGLWDPSIFWKESYAESLKKIVGANGAMGAGRAGVAILFIPKYFSNHIKMPTIKVKTNENEKWKKNVFSDSHFITG